jgi:hypothetical protein
MKTYLARFTLNDGEHEHTSYVLIKAKKLEDAIKDAESQEHDVSSGVNKEKLTYFDYGDGLTACTCDDVVELTEEQRDVIIELGLAYYMN